MGNQKKKLISLLVPCYNEEAGLREFYRQTSQVIDQITDYDFQFLFVNDGSRDHTLAIMRELREKDSRVSYVNLSRNFGKEIAMIAGMDYLTGDAAIIMDADLQDPPELIPEMISWWEKGYQDVSAKRRSRAGETFFKKWSSHAFLYHITKDVRGPHAAGCGGLPAVGPAVPQCSSDAAGMPEVYQRVIQLDWL